MMRRKNTNFALVAMVMVCWLAPPVSAASLSAADRGQDDPIKRPLPTLTVHGEAQLEKPADRVRIGLGVVSESESAETAIDENSRTMQRVIEALEDAGLDKSEYETGRFGVTPMYSRPGRGGGTREITGFRVTNQVVIKTKKMEMAGPLIGRASEAGTNSVNYVQFDIADPRKHRAEAITQAARNARADAAVLAEASGVRLVRVLSITLDNAGWQSIRPQYEMARAPAARGARVAVPPLQPGDVTIQAGVTIVYEITSANE